MEPLVKIDLPTTSAFVRTGGLESTVTLVGKALVFKNFQREPMFIFYLFSLTNHIKPNVYIGTIK